MKALKLIMLTLTSMMLINCGGGGRADKALNTNGQSERGIPIAEAKSIEEAEGLNPSDVLKGRIFMDDLYNSDTQNNFQAHVNSFLSPQLLANQIGHVNGDPNIDSTTNEETGIEFWGRGFSYENGQTLNLHSNILEGRNLLSDETAELRISVFQRVGGVLEEIPIHFNRKNGVLDNSAGILVDSVIKLESSNPTRYFVQLVFADSFGKVSLAGYVQASSTGTLMYEGQVTFRNLKVRTSDDRTEDSSHQEEVLGRFIVQACGFFQCS